MINNVYVKYLLVENELQDKQKTVDEIIASLHKQAKSNEFVLSIQ